MLLNDMNTAIEVLVEAIKTDYRDYKGRVRSGSDEMGPTTRSMISNFENGFKITEGNKYIKIIQGGSVWGFIAKNDDGKFKRGDILKPAGRSTPAKNAARGNVFGGYNIMWTGPHYL
jgi:sulfate adenylyltransferase subunit 1 (EFTu-like GTPase family)